MKTIIQYMATIGLLLVSMAFSFGQVTKTWDKTLGGANNDELYTIQPTGDGGFLLGGSSFSNMGFDKTENRKGLSDYWVVKIDAMGNKIWDKTFGGTNYDILEYIHPTTDGGFLLGGYSRSDISGDKTEDSRGKHDYWVIKIDAMGNKIWDKTFGGDNEDILKIIQSTNDGGFLLGGYSESNSGKDKTEANIGSADYWIIKIDAMGSKVWDKTLGGNSSDYLRSIQATGDGGFLLGGASTSGISMDKTEDNKGDYDYWVIKINAIGNRVWDKTLGGNNIDDLDFIQPTGDGSFLLGGYSLSNISGDKTENSKGQSDYWVIKINATGNKVWDKTVGGNGNDFLEIIQPTKDGNFLLGGYSLSGISGDKTEDSRGKSDYWVIKVDAMGNKIWDKTLGGSDDDILNCIQPITDSEFLLAGRSISNASGDKTENRKDAGASYNFDYWVVKIKDSSVTPAPVSFSVYPTSAASLDCIFIDASDISYLPANVTIIQLLPPFKMVLNQTISKSHECVDASKFSNGLYLVTITDVKGGKHHTRIRIF